MIFCQISCLYINKIFLQFHSRLYILLHYRSFCVNIQWSYLLYYCTLITTDPCFQFHKFTLVTRGFTFKFCRAHMHGLPCIICKKISKIVNVFVLNRQKQSFNGYSPIGRSKRTYRIHCLKFIVLPCN